LLYRGLRDRISDVPGEWTVKVCPNAGCGLTWLDPLPAEEDLLKLYADYIITHVDEDGEPTTWLQKVKERARKTYVARKYGYRATGPAFTDTLVCGLFYLLPHRLAEFDNSVAYLRRKEGGRVLDVGCGNGWLLLNLRQLNWDGEGLDFDELALVRAQAKGLNVHLGTMEGQGYPSDSFDAVTMGHVIEHVHRPLDWFQESLRILRPGGKLTVSTPNVSSWGHAVFKDSWSLLDPPRHLHLFTTAAMAKLARRAGFSKFRVMTTPRITRDMLLRSRQIRATGRRGTQNKPDLPFRLVDELLEFAEWLALKASSRHGEELVLIGEK
jgi:2-polyprenyl-3-methyl-5-hydroxy-6-metoxy-1,4-benzoquinol methylase